jgi:tRNA U55 pseudouridine synthase TruB
MTIREKIETIPKVTDERKALGADFRRDAVRESWNSFEMNSQDSYQVLSFSCIASSGSYMRSLSEKIAKELGTVGLAYSIHRTQIGRYVSLTKSFGFWLRRF